MPVPLCLPIGQYENAGRDSIGESGIIAGWGGTTGLHTFLLRFIFYFYRFGVCMCVFHC